MANPKYKFFRHELNENEVFRYSNGEEITFSPSTPELKEGAERIIKALEARGFLRMSGGNPRSVSFSKPEFCKAAYVGTFVNPFSFRDKVWNWSNHFAISRVMITLSEVYKHNGAANNASFRLSVNWSETKEKPEYVTSKWNGGTAGKLNDYGVEIPSTYDAVHVGGCVVYGELIRKFKPTISDKVLKNILDKAEEVFNSKEVFDRASLRWMKATSTCQLKKSGGHVWQRKEEQRLMPNLKNSKEDENSSFFVLSWFTF